MKRWRWRKGRGKKKDKRKPVQQQGLVCLRCGSRVPILFGAGFSNGVEVEGLCRSCFFQSLPYPAIRAILEALKI